MGPLTDISPSSLHVNTCINYMPESNFVSISLSKRAPAPVPEFLDPSRHHPGYQMVFDVTIHGQDIGISPVQRSDLRPIKKIV